MKIVIAGSREVGNRVIWVQDVLKSVLDSKPTQFEITEIVSGLARGIDVIGKQFAIANGIPVREFPANWDRHGRSAGYKRNEEMAQYADAAIIFWDGSSKGTKHMIDLCIQYKRPMILHII